MNLIELLRRKLPMPLDLSALYDLVEMFSRTLHNNGVHRACDQFFRFLHGYLSHAVQGQLADREIVNLCNEIVTELRWKVSDAIKNDLCGLKPERQSAAQDGDGLSALQLDQSASAAAGKQAS